MKDFLSKSVSFLLLVFLFVSCAHQPSRAYYCPMKCEGTKVYSKAGTCPVCGMSLVTGDSLKNRLHSKKYSLDLETSPSPVVAGKKVTLNFFPRFKESGKIIEDLSVVHEKVFHLFLVSEDLNWFFHEHPSRNPDGSFKLDFKFPVGGNFSLYGDITPKDEPNQVFPIALSVGGKPSAKAFPKAEKLSWSEGDYRIELTPVTKAPSARLTYQLYYKKKPLQGLQSYLGADGHSLILSWDMLDYVHAHPITQNTAPAGGGDHGSHGGHHHHEAEEAGNPQTSLEGEVVFLANLPRKTYYRVWTQFKHREKIITADFVVDASSAAPAESD